MRNKVWCDCSFKVGFGLNEGDDMRSMGTRSPGPSVLQVKQQHLVFFTPLKTLSGDRSACLVEASAQLHQKILNIKLQPATSSFRLDWKQI